MTGRIVLTGDVNLMNVTDAAVPFRQIANELRAADVAFSNLECSSASSARTLARTMRVSLPIRAWAAKLYACPASTPWASPTT